MSANLAYRRTQILTLDASIARFYAVKEDELHKDYISVYTFRSECETDKAADVLR